MRTQKWRSKKKFVEKQIIIEQTTERLPPRWAKTVKRRKKNIEEMRVIYGKWMSRQRNSLRTMRRPWKKESKEKQLWLNSNSAIMHVCHWQNESYSYTFPSTKPFAIHLPNETGDISTEERKKNERLNYLCVFYIRATNYNSSASYEPKKRVILVYITRQDQRINIISAHACMINWRTFK